MAPKQLAPRELLCLDSLFVAFERKRSEQIELGIAEQIQITILRGIPLTFSIMKSKFF